MARSLTAGMVTEVKAELLRPIALVEFNFDSGPLRLWSGLGPLPWNGFTWTGSGELLIVSAITEGADTKARGMTFILSGVSAAILSLVEGEDYQGRIARFYLGALDSNFAVVIDPFELRHLRMDYMEDVEDRDLVQITLHAEDILVDLERARERRYTTEDQHLDFPDDEFFDFVPDIQEIEIIGVG